MTSQSRQAKDIAKEIGVADKTPRVTILFIFLVVSFVGWTAGDWFGHRYFQQRLIDSDDSRMSVLESTLNGYVNRYSYAPKMLARFPEISDLLGQSENVDSVGKVNQLLEMLSRELAVESLFLMNDSGDIISTSNWQSDNSFIGHNFAYRPYFKQALKEGQGQYVALGKITRKIGLYLSHRIDIDNGAKKGVLVIKVGFDAVVDVLESFADDGQSIAVLTGPYNVVLAASVPEWKLRSLTAPSVEISQAITTRYSKEVLGRQALFSADGLTGDKPVEIGEPASGIYLVVERAFPPFSGGLHVFKSVESLATELRLFGAAGVLATTVLFLVALMIYLQRQVAFRVKKSSIHDPLTGLYNRVYMDESVPGMLARDNRDNSSSLALVILDLDHFKHINDHYGSQAGDEVLRQVGRQILGQTREGDIAVRYSGESFAIFLRCSALEDAVGFARRLSTIFLIEPMTWEGQVLLVTASFGVSLRELDQSLDDLLHAADAKLQKAKADGRDRIVS